MDYQELSLRDQVIAINHWLHQLYEAPVQLSELLLQEGLDQAAINALKQHHLAAFLHNFQDELRNWLSNTFPERLVIIMTRRFSLDGRAKASLEALGDHQALSRERIRQLEQGSLRRIRSSKRRKTICQILLLAAETTLGLPITATRPEQDIPLPGNQGETGAANQTTRRRIQRHPCETHQETLVLFQAGQTPAAIAEHRSLNIETIYNHLAWWIGDGLVSINAIIPPAIYRMIEQTLLNARPGATKKAIKAMLPPEILYGQIACVRADLRRSATPESRHVQGANNERSNPGPGEPA